MLMKVLNELYRGVENISLIYIKDKLGNYKGDEMPKMMGT